MEIIKVHRDIKTIILNCLIFLLSSKNQILLLIYLVENVFHKTVTATAKAETQSGLTV